MLPLTLLVVAWSFAVDLVFGVGMQAPPAKISPRNQFIPTSYVLCAYVKVATQNHTDTKLTKHLRHVFKLITPYLEPSILLTAEELGSFFDASSAAPVSSPLAISFSEDLSKK